MINQQRPYSRKDRFSDTIKTIIIDVLRNKVFIQDIGLPTITKVNTSPDLKHSKIFISFINNKREYNVLIDELNNNKKHIRYHLGKELKARYVPEIKFYFDDTYINVTRINDLLDRAKDK